MIRSPYGWGQNSYGHDLLLPGQQTQPQHIYYYCYLITPATTTTIITTAISYRIAVDATSTIQFSYKIQVLLLLAPAILIFNCYSYHPPRRWSCFTSLCICEVTAKWIVDCCDLLVLLCIPSISITSLPPIQHRLYCNELLPPSKKNGHGIRSRILSTMNVRYGQHIHWFIVIILHEQSYKYCLCTKIGAMQ
jgi:hypothetical protein